MTRKYYNSFSVVEMPRRFDGMMKPKAYITYYMPIDETYR